MRITVVTPSFNQAAYLEQTILSVLSQGIDDLEYIVMDGGSTDGSVDVIRRYEHRLAYWQSQHDGGQTNAIRAGFARATGDILCWINSDDYYRPGVLKRVRDEFERNRDLQLLYGDYILLYPDGREVPKKKISFDFDICLHAYLMIPQPSSFWTSDLYRSVGGLNADFQYAFDYDFFLRAGAYLRGNRNAIRHVPEFWSKFRVHETSKSVADTSKFKAEGKRIKAQFAVSDKRIVRKLRGRFELSRALWRFYCERGFIPLRKEGGKA